MTMVLEYHEVMASKERLSVSVDADLIEEGRAAVAAGEAENLSDWVNKALRRYSSHERRLRGLREMIADYELDHGEITEEEIADTWRNLRANAIVVRDGVSFRRDTE